MEDDLKKNEMEDDLNFKTVLLSLFNNKNLKKKWFWHHRDWPSVKYCCNVISTFVEKGFFLSIMILFNKVCIPLYIVHATDDNKRSL